jgi:hypothetical protein
VWELAGGLEAWREQGFATEGKPDTKDHAQPVAALSGSMWRKAS